MADVHGVDVSWMAHGPSKDKAPKNTPPSAPKNAQQKSSPPPRQPIGSPPPPTTTTATSDTIAIPAPAKTLQRSNSTNTHGRTEDSGAAEAKPIPIPKSSLNRTNSLDRNGTPPSPSPSGRRPSWFSNISSKFSPSTPPSLSSADGHAPSQTKTGPGKTAVLAPSAKQQGDAPYTPAPPRTNSGNNILGIFRRLSTSAAGLGHGIRGNQGLVERRVLNVDNSRERCKIAELDQAKLRRVAFCVDVEIAPQPKYSDDPKTGRKSGAQTEKPAQAPSDAAPAEVTNVTGSPVAKDKDSDATKKRKDKKKKNEEERKARKEKKRKLAEANGSVPIEIYRSSSESSLVSADQGDAAAPKPSHCPTINPVRIYRRCCQLRETPILKKITEQLTDASNWSPETGVVEKLDLSGYWMQLADLVTLGDYLAVVPVKEVLLESCGLTDEGLRVVLAGVLAAKKPDFKKRGYANYADHSSQGGVVERLVLKNNKLGPEGWKHICLFIYLSHSVKALDLSGIPFPHLVTKPAQEQNGGSPPPSKALPAPTDISHLLSKSLAGRLAGSDLELLNLGDTNPATAQLGVILDGAIQCGLRRLGLAHNHIDGEGVGHVIRLLEAGKCEGLDLGGNDLRDHVETIVKAIPESHSLWALSLADCNLEPASVCSFFPTLVKLRDFRFIDLSHNQELCKEDAKTIQMLRRCLPKMKYLKRIHLTDVSMTSEQAIALAEILPEIPQLANITLTENPELAKLADAESESAREEACALYASFLAAARVSRTLISVEIEVPSEGSGEIVKALAKQVVAYCLRNMDRLQVGDLENAEEAEAVLPYPDVLAHLVGRDENDNGVGDLEGTEPPPDADYVIGGTGVVKALACCLKNRGDDDGSRRPSLDSPRETEAEAEAETRGSGATTPRPSLAPGKAKDMSKHLLSSARKIRDRLQPALARAKGADAGEDVRKLSFLDQTLSGIIRRFEDEFPETREVYVSHPPGDAAAVEEESRRRKDEAERKRGSEAEMEAEREKEREEGERESEEDDEPGHIRPVSSSSSLHNIARPLDTEEGRTHRRGHRFRTSIVHSPEKYEEVLLASLEEMERDPNHVRMLREMIGDLGDEVLDEAVREKGPVRVFREDRERVMEALRDVDPEHWERFRESQVMARENVLVGRKESAVEGSAVEE